MFGEQRFYPDLGPIVSFDGPVKKTATSTFELVHLNPPLRLLHRPDTFENVPTVHTSKTAFSMDTSNGVTPLLAI